MMRNPLEAREITEEVLDERSRQDARWGEQNHPDFPPDINTTQYRTHFQEQADAWKSLNDLRAKQGVLAWDGILMEELFEALAEAGEGGSPINLREELLQVAAVALCWVECVDRRHE